MSNIPTNNLPDIAAERALQALESRRAEVAQYDDNIVMYQTIRDTLPNEWPERLAQFKGVKDHQGAAKQVADEDVELLAQLLMREHCEQMARTEMLERTKAAAILAVLEAKLP